MDADSWNQLVLKMPSPHFLQSWQWGQVKANYGWRPHYWFSKENDGVALILERTSHVFRIGPKINILYVPRGPLADWNFIDISERVLQELENFANQKAAIFIKIDPEVILGRGIPGTVEGMDENAGLEFQSLLRSRKWIFSPDQIQFRNTFWLDLHGTEEDLLGRMKQKTRYNLRLAEKKGVTIRTTTRDDYSILYKLYAETSIRDGFVIRNHDYYNMVWSMFEDARYGHGFIAEVEGQPVAGLMLMAFGKKAWYLYGMSSHRHREKMPNYLLQWEAIRFARSLGCTQYDLWGAPDQFEESDALWGIYRFKEGLGAKVIRLVGAWDYPLKPGLYSLYTRILPKLLNIMRARGKLRTKREIT